MRLSADTLARLRAAAETMGISIDELAERCILDSLPTIEHEDLLAPLDKEHRHGNQPQ